MGKTLFFSQCLSSLNFKNLWVPANLMLGGKPCDGLASDSEGSRNTPSHFMPYKLGYNGLNADLPLPQIP